MERSAARVEQVGCVGSRPFRPVLEVEPLQQRVGAGQKSVAHTLQLAIVASRSNEGGELLQNRRADREQQVKSTQFSQAARVEVELVLGNGARIPTALRDNSCLSCWSECPAQPDTSTHSTWAL